MATNTERGTPFDLRTTIPLAKETLVRLARKPKRNWLIPFLTLIAGISFATMMLELMFSPGPVSALAFEGELRSKLIANYGADPITAKIHELRLTIMQEVLAAGKNRGSEQSVSSQQLNDPVPTATLVSLVEQVVTSEPSPTELPTATPSPVPIAAPPNTPNPPTAPTAVPALDCSKLKILSMWIDGDDRLKAQVRNDGSKKANLTETVLEWPHVPPPAYVDWFEFDGNRYFSGDDSDSPTVKSGTNRDLGAGKTRTWEADFDDEPDEGIYGHFGLTLVFNLPGQGSCTLTASTYKDLPATPVPSPTPSATPLPPSATPTPTDTPTLIPTATETPTPEPPTPTPTPTL